LREEHGSYPGIRVVLEKSAAAPTMPMSAEFLEKQKKMWILKRKEEERRAEVFISLHPCADRTSCSLFILLVVCVLMESLGRRLS